MMICMRCERDHDSSEQARIEFENQSLTISGILCKKCAERFLDWLLKENDD